MNEALHRATKIMLIRHAEKASKPHSRGVNEKGKHDEESLSVRGWQRAGALVAYFVPDGNFFQNSTVATPQFLFASKPVKHDGSLRPIETITPLAEKLGIEINSDFMKFEEEKMLETALACPGVVLICWQHEFLPKIASRILGGEPPALLNWADDCFDEIWVFDKTPDSNTYLFRRVRQNLLSGDLA